VSEYVGGSIYDALTSEFGPGTVFRDLESLPPGVDWRGGIEANLNKCKVVVAFIPEEWERELKLRVGSEDTVKKELETAAERGVAIVPIFTFTKSWMGWKKRFAGLNRVLKKCQLKDALTGKANRQTLLLRNDPDFGHDIERLKQAIWLHLRSPPGDTSASREASGDAS
jgi:hypothetical protein